MTLYNARYICYICLYAMLMLIDWLSNVGDCAAKRERKQMGLMVSVTLAVLY